MPSIIFNPRVHPFPPPPAHPGVGSLSVEVNVHVSYRRFIASLAYCPKRAAATIHLAQLAALCCLLLLTAVIVSEFDEGEPPCVHEPGRASCIPWFRADRFLILLAVCPLPLIVIEALSVYTGKWQFVFTVMLLYFCACMLLGLPLYMLAVRSSQLHEKGHVKDLAFALVQLISNIILFVFMVKGVNVMLEFEDELDPVIE